MRKGKRRNDRQETEIDGVKNNKRFSPRETRLERSERNFERANIERRSKKEKREQVNEVSEKTECDTIRNKVSDRNRERRAVSSG